MEDKEGQTSDVIDFKNTSPSVNLPNTPYSLEGEVLPHLNRLGKEIGSIYRAYGFLNPQEAALYPHVHSRDLEYMNYFKEEIHEELKREARNYLKERYLTKVFDFRDNIRLKMSLDSDAEVGGEHKTLVSLKNTRRVFHSLESALVKTKVISPNLRYSVGCHIRSSPLLNGELSDAMEPVLKVNYKKMEIKTKYRPSNNVCEIEIRGRIPVRRLMNGRLGFSVSSENLSNADWEINYSLENGNFFFIGGALPVADFKNFEGSLYAGIVMSL